MSVCITSKRGAEVDEYFGSLNPKTLKSSDDSTDEPTKYVLTLKQTLEYHDFKDFISVLQLDQLIRRSVLTFTDWSALVCLKGEFEVVNLHLPPQLQHLDMTLSRNFFLTNLLEIYRLKKLKFLHFRLPDTKSRSISEAFGILMKDNSPTLESFFLTNIPPSCISIVQFGIIMFLKQSPGIKNLALRFSKKKVYVDLLSLSLILELFGLNFLEFLYLEGVKVFSNYKFINHQGNFSHLQHLFIHDCSSLRVIEFTCLSNYTPKLHYLSVRNTEVGMKEFGFFLSEHRGLQRVTFYTDRYEPHNWKHHEVMKYISGLKPPQTKKYRFCLCEFLQNPDPRYSNNPERDMALKRNITQEFCNKLNECIIDCSVQRSPDLNCKCQDEEAIFHSKNLFLI